RVARLNAVLLAIRALIGPLATPMETGIVRLAEWPAAGVGGKIAQQHGRVVHRPQRGANEVGTDYTRLNKAGHDFASVSGRVHVPQRFALDRLSIPVCWAVFRCRVSLINRVIRVPPRYAHCE